MRERSKGRNRVCWLLQLGAAGILGQTLFFKFTAAPESVYIFSRLGIEPWGRIASGVAELIAVVLLLVPRTAVVGAALSLVVISGALVAHLTRLGIVVMNDGGLLFGLAVAVFLSSASILWLRSGELVALVGRLSQPRSTGRSAARPARA